MMGGNKYSSMVSIQWFLKWASEKQADYLLITKQNIRLSPTTLLQLYRRAMYEPHTVVSVVSRQRILIPSDLYSNHLHAFFYAVCRQYHVESTHGSEFNDCMLFDVPGSLCNVSKREKKERQATYTKRDDIMSTWNDDDDEDKDQDDIHESPMTTPTRPQSRHPSTGSITDDQGATDVMDAFEKLSDSFTVVSSAGDESSLPIRLLAYTSSLLATTTTTSRCVAVKSCVEESNAVVFVEAERTVEAAMSRQKQVFLDDFFGCLWLLLAVGPLTSTQKSRLQGSVAVARAVLQLYVHCSGVTVGLVILTETLGFTVEKYFQSTFVGDYCVLAYLVLYLAFPYLIINRSRGFLGDAWIVVLDVFVVLNAVLGCLFVQFLFRIMFVTTSGVLSMIALVVVTSAVMLSPLLRACIAKDYTSFLILLRSWIPHTVFLPTSFVLVPIHALFYEIIQQHHDGPDVNQPQDTVHQSHGRHAAWGLCLLNATLAGLLRMLRVVTLNDMSLLAVLLQAFIYSSFATTMCEILLVCMRGKRLDCNWFYQRYHYQKKKSESEQATVDLRRRFGDNRDAINKVIASIRLAMGDDGHDNTNEPQTTTMNAITNDNEMMI